jgi:hypothetical protein
LELQAQSDAAKEVFPTRVTQGFISNSQRKIWFFILYSSSNLATLNNIFVSSTNMSGYQIVTACNFNKTKSISKSIFVFLNLMIIESKRTSKLL